MSQNNMLNLGAKLAIGGDVTFSGAHTFTGTLTADTSVTFPTSGTLATTSAIPSFPLSFSNGGTGIATASTHLYAPICTGTTATGVVQIADTGMSNSGYVLTSTGAASLPTWQAAGGGVSSISGTANQIDASASTGAVTLSLPSVINFAFGSNIVLACDAGFGPGTGSSIIFYTNTDMHLGNINDTYLYINTSNGQILMNAGVNDISLTAATSMSLTSVGSLSITSSAGTASIAGTSLTLTAGGTPYYFPTTQGANGDTLLNDGSGNLSWGSPAISNPLLLSGDPVLGFTDVGGSAVNYISLTNSATGDPVIVTTAGSDPFIALKVIDGSGSEFSMDGSGIALIKANTTLTMSSTAYGRSIVIDSSALTMSSSSGTSIALDNSNIYLQIANTYSFSLPSTDGASGSVLTTSGSGNTSWAKTIQYAQVSMTSSDIDNMYTTPFQIIAAPGSNKMIVVVNANIELIYGGTAFLLGGALNLQYTNTNHGGGDSVTGGTIPAAGLLATSSRILTFPPSATSSTFVVGTDSEVGVYLSNQTAAFTTGNSTANVNVAYYIMSV